MAYRLLISLLVVLALVGAACADGTDGVVAFDPDGADSCQELADMFIGSHSRMLDALGTMADEDLEGDIPSEVEVAGAEIMEWLSGTAGERVSELCPGGVDELETLVCEQAPQLVAQGSAAERHLRESFPTCGQP
jgi:hypothetical protein